MRCPKCPKSDSKVIESREVGEGQAIRRRRECLSCSNRFTTYERLERPHLVVIKRDGTRQLFDREKLLSGVAKSTEKTTVTASELESLIIDIEDDIFDSGETEVSSQKIGEMVMQRLAKINDVAYVRFASVYRSFNDLESFEEALKLIKGRGGKK